MTYSMCLAYNIRIAISGTTDLCKKLHDCFKDYTVFQEYFVAGNFNHKIFVSDIFVLECAGILINAPLACSTARDRRIDG